MTGDRDELIARVRRLFLEELGDAVRTLNGGLLDLEVRADAGTAGELVRELFRVAHGVKGAAHAAGVLDAVAAAGRLEEAFAEMRDQAVVGPVDVTSLLVEVDELERIRDGLERRPDEQSASADPDGSAEPAAGTTTRLPAVGGPAAARVDTRRLDEMVELTSDLVGTAGRLSGLSSDLAEVAERPAGSVEGRDLATITDTAAQLSRELERLASQLANSAVALTFQAFSEAVHGLDRAAHDLATSGGKQVRVRVSGGDVEVDRAVISGLREPLLHVVRNAVDHGIEPPDERRAAAKGPVGTVDIAARLDGDALVVEIRDDGRGIDHDAVRAAAARAGVSGAPGAGVDDATGAAAPLDTSELLFLPGLTTARQVTDASGRGVGLDAVRDRVEGLGGTVRLHSSSPRGTTVSISVPANTALVKVLVVRSGGELLSLPLAKVARVLAVDPSAVHEAEGRTRVAVDGTTVPMAALHATAGISADRGLAAGPLKVAMVEVAGRPFAFAVDELVGESEAIVKPPPRRLADVRAVRGRAILADGNIALLLNIAVCVEGALSRPEQLVVDDATGTPAPTRVLLVEDSRTTRVLEAGILRAAGYAVVEAEDGAAAWELLQEHEVDLVLSDVDMPRLDGVELCRLVRRSPELADLPVVLVTSLGDEADRRRGVDAGASAYIVKAEFDQDSLLDVLERVR